MDRLLSLWLPANVSRASKQRNISPGGCYESVNRLLRAFYQIDPETDRDVPSPPEDRYHFSSVSSMETRCLVCVCVCVCMCVCVYSAHCFELDSYMIIHTHSSCCHLCSLLALLSKVRCD